MDTIKREDAIKSLDDGMNKWYSNVTLRQSMHEAINGIPSAENKGEWIDKRESSKDVPHYKCTACGYDLYSSVKTNFCPNCGAKMKGADYE